MRVMYLTINPNRQSTTVPTEGWFRQLQGRGLCPVLVSHQIGAFHVWAKQQGIAAYHVPLPFPSRLKPWPFLSSLWRLRALVRQHNIQIIHCNEQDTYPIGGYLGRLSGLPVVVSVHFTMQRGFCQWAFGGARRPKRMFFISRGSLEACRRGVEGIIPESDWRLLYNGLDIDHFRPDPDLRDRFRQEHGLDSELVIGTACALRPRKQLEHLFDAVSRLSTPRVRLLVAGGPVSGDERYADQLLESGKQRLDRRFSSLGHLDELRGLYNGLDLFVNTSQEEACSISIMEALACGCPVLGYPSKSVDEQILPGGGEIVEQDRPDLLAAALDRWLQDRSRLGMGRLSARRRAEDTFDIRKLAVEIWHEYEDVLD